jgi:hypothetical protein
MVTTLLAVLAVLLVAADWALMRALSVTEVKFGVVAEEWPTMVTVSVCPLGREGTRTMRSFTAVTSAERAHAAPVLVTQETSDNDEGS